jgi:predicted transcriptional regulator
MLHFAVNKPIGATRGESDLSPVLPWALRYSEWLKDRVRLNRQRTRQGVFDVEIADDSIVEQKRQQLRTSNPIEAGIYVHGPGEKTTMHKLEIGAGDAAEDGKVLRLANATGANIALHYLGEGEGTNYATAKEMGEPSARFFTERQSDFCAFLVEMVDAAYRRRAALGLAQLPEDGDLQLFTATTEVARADNQSLATAAREIVQALAQMKAQGWIDDTTAAKTAFKFAGEALSEDEITQILAKAKTEKPREPLDEPQDQGDPE